MNLTGIKTKKTAVRRQDAAFTGRLEARLHGGTGKMHPAVTGALVLALIAAVVLVKWMFFRSATDTDFVMNDRSLLGARAGVVVLRPTHYPFLKPNRSGINVARPPQRPNAWRAMGRNVPLRNVIGFAYEKDPFRVVLPPDAPTNYFDFLVTAPTNQNQHLQSALRRTLGYTAQTETRDTGVLALRIESPDLPGLRISTNSDSSFPWGKLVRFRVGYLVWQLETRLQQPVVDETGLTNFYDFDWDFRPRDRATLDKMLAHLGLGLESKTEPLEVLVVKKGR